MKIFLRILSVLLLLLIIAGGVVFYYLHEAVKPVDIAGHGRSEVVEIKPGATAASIGQELQDLGLIRSAEAFRLLVRYSKKGDALKMGHFRISTESSPVQILEQLVKGQTLSKKITIPEGLTLKQIAEVVAKNQTCDAEEFLELVTKHGKDFGKHFPDNLEGYLLPDTYQIPWVCTAKDLATIMTRRFDELARPLWNEQCPLSLADTIVLASLVEREAQVAAERPIIAGVYINRINDGMHLECDATIQFALGKQKEYLLFKDLEIESPYNTYKNPGLPPGPICCPGLAAIKASVNPTKTDYYYYVRNDVKGDGSHVFSRNFTEHGNAIKQYQR